MRIKEVCKMGYTLNDDYTIPERCHVDWDGYICPTLCKDCPSYNNKMKLSEAINLLEVIKFCDVDEVAKIEAIDTVIDALRKQNKGDK